MLNARLKVKTHCSKCGGKNRSSLLIPRKPGGVSHEIICGHCREPYIARVNWSKDLLPASGDSGNAGG